MSRWFTRKAYWTLAVAIFLTMVLPWSVFASDVDVAVVDVTVPNNAVTLAPGSSGAIVINLSVTGNQAGTATFEVYRNWTLAGGTFTGSNPQEFTVAPRSSSDPATTFSTTGTVAVDAGQGVGTFTLAVGAFDITNTNTTGAKLAAGRSSNYQVNVAPPADTTPPVITPTITGTQGDNGWYTSDVTVSWTVTDAQSPISSSSGCGTTTLTSDTAGQTLTCTATSTGGTSTQSVTVKLDKTGPTNVALAPSAAPTGQNGWYTSDVTIATVGGDVTSGPVTCTADQEQTTETAGTTLNGSCTNQAGLTTNAAPLTIKLDKSAPTAQLSVTAGMPGASNWYTSDVTIQTSGSDSISAPVICTAVQQQIAETTGQAFNGFCTNAAGLTTNAAPLTIKLDKTGPANPKLSVTAGTVGLNGWYTSDVTVQAPGFEDISNPMACSPDQYLTTDTDAAGEMFNGSCINDAGLTSHADALTVLRDATHPTIAAVATVGSATYDGSWTNQDVVVRFPCDEPQPGSGIAGVCPADVIVTSSTGATGQAIFGQVADHAGNQATSNTVTVYVDKDAPVITASATTADGNAYTGGWTNQTVTVSFVCQEQGGSGLAGVCPSPVVVANDTATTGAVVAASIADVAGNQTTSNVITVLVDKTAPVITAQGAQPAAPNGLNGWYTVPVVETFQAADAGSGLIGQVSPYTFTQSSGDQEGAAVTIDSGSVSDAAGNVNPGITSAAYQIDLSNPTDVAGAPDRAADANGWYNHSVNVVFTGTDAVSGIGTCTSLTYAGPDAQNLTADGICVDKAGRTSAVATSASFNYDGTQPTISATLDKSAAITGWYNSITGAPTVSFVCDDDLSGIDGSCPADHTFGNGADQSHSASAFDIAGNGQSAGVTDIDVDLVVPSIAASLNKSAAASGWFNIATGAPTVSFICSDTISGLAGACLASSTFGDGANQSRSETIWDLAGNANSAGVSNISVDLTTPTGITFGDGPAGGANYHFGDVPAAPTCSAQDTGSGIASCFVSGYGTVVGTHTLTATATDVAGNTATATRTYTVLSWTPKGFYQPVDMTPVGGQTVWNTVKGGSTVPLKFEVFAGAAELTDTSIVSSLTRQVSCGTGGTEDAIEVTATGGTSLRYDTVSGQFVYNWQTPKLPGKCYDVTLTTQDGSKLTANFKLK